MSDEYEQLVEKFTMRHPVREQELSSFNVGQAFYDALRTRCHKAHKSNQLLETETA